MTRFPWGELEYFSIANVRSQFRDIFLGRQYAFIPEVPFPVVVDCGGNVGLSAIWFRRSFPQCRLTVYEADPVLGEVLRGNLARAGYSDADIRIAAAWIAEGTMPFQRGGADEGAIAENGTITVRSVSLANELPERVDLLKLDIEGAEFAVLEHLCESRAIERVRHLVAEFHVLREQSGEFLRLLMALQQSGLEVVLGSAVPWNRNGAPRRQWGFESRGSGDTLVEVYAVRK